MALGQSSFRRILLSRLLLLSVPVLLLGVYVTYRKARSAFLETARQNLTESAVRKGDSIRQSIESLQTNLASASDAAVLKSDFYKNHQLFLEELAEVLPTEVECLQLTDLKSGRVTAGTCNAQVAIDTSIWSQQRNQIVLDSRQIDVKLMPPSSSPIQNNDSQLKLWLTAPVYNSRGRLRYALSVKAAILHQERVEPGSLDGYPVVINQEGIILAHPFIQRVGRNIKQMPDAQRLESILKNAIDGRPDFLHLFFLEKDGVELVAGYSSIPSPITLKSDRKWIILAVTPLDAALLPLKAIREALVVMTIGLIAASSLATLYISRELARPLEQLRDYALKEEHLHSADRLPQNFDIREFNQLSVALNEMVARLRAWGEEIISAWKEAQNANQLKSEFLATTSHELRTPLNGIINCIRVVKDGYCDDREEEIEFLQQADDAAIHLLGIINDVLDISKIEAGKLSVKIEKADLSKIINEVIDLQTVPIQKKGLQFNTPQWQEKIYVSTDPAKLKQVLINVVGNAVKFTETGEISISVTVDEEDTHLARENGDRHKSERDLYVSDLFDVTKHKKDRVEGLSQVYALDSSRQKQSISSFKQQIDLTITHKAIVTVKDTGIGIDPRQQDKLFRPFVMVDGTTTRKFGGTGLGLAISRNLMELMGGNIFLFSGGEGKGTTVKIKVPLADVEQIPQTSDKEKPTVNS